MMKILFFVILIIMQPCWGGQVVTKMQKVSSNGYSVNYTWDTYSKMTDEVKHNCKASTCYYGIIARTYHPAYTPPRTDYRGGNLISFSSNNEKMDTWGEVSDAYVQTHGKSGTYQQSINNTVFECALFGILDNGSSGPSNRPPLSAPGEVCLASVMTNECTISTVDAELEHGVVNPSEIEGHISTGRLIVSCGSPLPIKFRLNPGGDLLLKNGEISSHLTINGNEVDEEIDTQDGRNEFELKSRLHAEKIVTAGAFSGSQTLIMTVQ